MIMTTGSFHCRDYRATVDLRSRFARSDEVGQSLFNPSELPNFVADLIDFSAGNGSRFIAIRVRIDTQR